MNYTLVGAFVLLLGAVLIAGLIWLASGGAFRKTYDLYLAVEDESVDGLSINAPVKYNGVDVGKVREIRLDPEDPQRVRLLFAIEHGTQIKTDTLAMLKTQGLTGIAYVELSGGAPGALTLPATAQAPYPQIATRPSLGARLENVLTSVLAKLDRTSSNIDALLSDENKAAVTSSLADIAAVMHTITAHKDTLDAGMRSAASTFENTARAARKLGPVIDQVGQSAVAIQTLGNQAAAASLTADKTLASIGTDARVFTTETLPEIQSLLLELQQLTVSLRRVSEETERNPAGFVFGPSPVPEGPGESSKERRR